jgi:CheY-like chemotaxis protein
MTQDNDNSLVQEIRQALNHLYDPADLRLNPILNRLGLASQRDPAGALRRVLSEAVTDLKPEKTIPLEANGWHIYRLLVQRFIEQSSQTEVARNLSLGIRQYRRHEAKAISVLADYLRAHYDLRPFSGTGETSPGESGTPSREAELAWLQESLPSQPMNVIESIQAAVQLVRPLAQTRHVSLEIDASHDLPLAIGQLTTFRQALLTVLSAAVRCAAGGRVKISAQVRGWEVDCRILPVNPSISTASFPPEESENLDIVRQLVEALGGVFQIQTPGGGGCAFEVHLALPMLEGVLVLAVDDNIDTLQLLQRYTIGTRYRFKGLRDPQEALRVALDLSPQIIVLDVMLPHIDGWELLGRLHEHPDLQHIPVLICSILPHEQLAATIGAAGFIRKPVTRRAFLQALDDHLPHLTSQEES